MIQALKAWWAEFKAYHAYIRDPHGWEQRRRIALHLKYQPRPALIRVGENFICHPELVPRMEAEIVRKNKATPFAGSPLHFFGQRMAISELATEHPPEGGWPDVTVPVKPRLAP